MLKNIVIILLAIALGLSTFTLANTHPAQQSITKLNVTTPILTTNGTSTVIPITNNTKPTMNHECMVVINTNGKIGINIMPCANVPTDSVPARVVTVS
jgi:ABC-type phosphate transport system substrate-binding protein